MNKAIGLLTGGAKARAMPKISAVAAAGRRRRLDRDIDSLDGGDAPARQSR